jgi:Ca2+-binding RTX toxin-like protein
LALASVVVLATAAGLGVARSTAHAGTTSVVGNGFTVTPGDLAFILKQIKIAEHHAATATPANPCGTLVGPGPDQIPDALTSYGLRTVDGSCNNLLPGREKFAAADVPFPRLAGNPVFRNAEGVPAGFLGPGSPAVPSSSYAQKKGFVFDSQPRTISNLIVDQTSTNPAAVAAAQFPVRTQGDPPSATPCTTEPGPGGSPPGVPAGCTAAHHTLFIPNVTTDVGLSPPFNSWFTFFGQFFDHGVDQTVKSGGTVFVPLKADDPLVTLGPDGQPNTGDEVPPDQRFIVLTRAQNQPGPDGILGDDPATPAVDESADDIQNANNTDTPWVDQSQTYGSHGSHQVFLREYVLNTANHPVSTGKLLGGLAAGQTYPGSPDMTEGESTWAAVKLQAATKLGLLLKDVDVSNIPMLATDPYGKFIPGPARGLPQYVTKTGLVEGNLASPVPVPANVLHFDTPFLTDIAHNADPGSVGPCTSPGVPTGCLSPDTDTAPSHDFAHQPAGTYDDELLNAHAACGDGRCNENIALTTVHMMFHSEHNRLVDYIKGVLLGDTSPEGVAALPEWQLLTASNPQGWNGERLFQAARFVTEMEYQHLVFEEFARKMVPAIRPFHVYSTDINPAIPAEFAAATYRFGHSMLTDTISRTNVDTVTGAKTPNDISLLDAFLNPPEFYNGGSAGTLSAQRAAGSIIMGSVDQVGNEIDEFVTETLRNNLLGLPLDLPVLNIARARDVGIPPLNEVRRQIFAKTNDGQLAPYKSWVDYGEHLKHPESLINFVAAYGTHPTIIAARDNGYLAQRDAARAIVAPQPGDVQPADAADFMNSTGAWANNADGVTRTGLDDVDMWVGALAEVTSINGGLLGTTNNYVFQNTLENLQDGDRLYYLARTPGLNLRSQLEGNSFAEMIERNTIGTNSLKADVFATADCKFQLANLAGTAAGFAANGTNVTDDPSTACDESKLLTRMPDGTIKYKQINSVDPPGINGQSVYNGTDGVDRVYGGNDNDTLWGDNGNDVLEGSNGDDVVLGGNGNDIMTDQDGADVMKGGPGNDAIDAGPGNDLVTGGDGSDFINGGANDNEEFAGPGNDFIIAGLGADAPFGGGGDDWMEFGLGQDIGAGDHEAPFFDDPGETKPGNDVMIGQPGENDYDAEGGDDIMSQNPAIDRNAGAGGFDWAIHQYDTVPANDDMMINNFLIGVPVQIVVNRDRWQETEADSGSQFNDVIKGTGAVVGLPRVIGAGGGGFQGCDVLDQAGLDRIKGLDALVPPLTGDVNANQPDVDPANVPHPPATSVVALSASGRCPLSGPFWGEGDIELGGAGSDSFTGREGNDIIDGDQELRVRISVRTDPANPATEIGTTDLMENQYKHDAAGNPIGNTLQQDVFSGLIDPGNLVIVRELVNNAGPADIDTSNYSGPRSQYTITPNPDGSITVCDSVTIAAAAGEVLLHEALKGDGCDILWRIERLQFADQLVSVGTATAPAVTTSPTAAAGVAFGNQTTNTTAAARTVTVSNTGNGPLSISSLTLAGTNPADFAIASNTCLAASVAAGGNCTVNVSFTPTATGARSASLRIADNAAGSPQSIPLTGTGVAPPPSATFVFGTQVTTGSKADSNTAGVAEAFKTTTASTGTVTNLRVFVDTGSTAANLVVGLYSNSATNHPGTLLATGSLASPVIGQFNMVPVTPTANVTAGQTLWIAILGPSGTLRFRDKAGVGAGNSEVSATTGLAAMPATWTSGSSFTDGTLSAWAAGTVTATPPPPPPPPGLAVLVGNGTTETHVDFNAPGLAEAFKAVAATTGSVSALRVFLDAGSTATSVKIGLYNNAAGNHPGTLLTTGTITAPVANAQNTVTVPPAAVTAGQTYWIAVLGPAGTVKFRDHTLVGAGSSETSSASTLTSLPNTWVTGASFTDGNISAVGMG